MNPKKYVEHNRKTVSTDETDNHKRLHGVNTWQNVKSNTFFSRSNLTLTNDIYKLMVQSIINNIIKYSF